MFLYFTRTILFYKQPTRGVLLKCNPEKFCKIHQKASVVESFFSPVKLDSTMAVFMTNFQKIFRMVFLQKQPWAAAAIALT